MLLTEFNPGLGLPNNFADTPYAAAFVTYLAGSLPERAPALELYSYWTFSDIFEEGGQDPTPFHNGFGMMTSGGVPKPVQPITKHNIY